VHARTDAANALALGARSGAARVAALCGAAACVGPAHCCPAAAAAAMHIGLMVNPSMHVPQVASRANRTISRRWFTTLADPEISPSIMSFLLSCQTILSFVRIFVGENIFKTASSVYIIDLHLCTPHVRHKAEFHRKSEY
jgi:hypothetical protein